MHFNVVLLLTALVGWTTAVQAAPAPVARPFLTREVIWILQEAESCAEEAADISRAIFVEGGNLTAQERAEKVTKRTRLLFRTSELYARALRSLERGGNGRDSWDFYNLTAMKTARAWKLAGNHELALAHYQTVATRNVGEKRAEALAGMVACYNDQGNHAEVKKLLKLLAKELIRLPENQRRPWERWVELTEQNLSQQPVKG